MANTVFGNFLKHFVKRFSKYATMNLDIDECADNKHDCDSNATCTDTEESFTCKCNNGYTGNGKTCTEEIENEQGKPMATGLTKIHPLSFFFDPFKI